jgi:hypothetical protein
MRHTIVGRHGWWRLGAVAVVLTVVAFGHPEAQAQQKKPNRFCRKVRFLGQNPKNGYQKFNDLQTAQISEKQLCDRTPRSPSSSFHLCQHRFGLGQPEHHVHGAVEVDSSRQLSAGEFPLGV